MARSAAAALTAGIIATLNRFIRCQNHHTSRGKRLALLYILPLITDSIPPVIALSTDTSPPYLRVGDHYNKLVDASSLKSVFSSCSSVVTWCSQPRPESLPAAYKFLCQFHTLQVTLQVKPSRHYCIEIGSENFYLSDRPSSLTASNPELVPIPPLSPRVGRHHSKR